jgi:hypothetical protein
MQVSLIIPAFSYGPALERTVHSMATKSDDLVIISTAFWEKDREAMRRLTDKVVILDWNYTMLHGFGEMMNRGTGDAKNDWCLLFGVGETFARELRPFFTILESSPEDRVYLCDHHNDTNQWKRVWNRKSGVRWSGLIHEELVGGNNGGLLFRMQDTPKEPRPDPYEQETLHYIKTILYHWQYHRLRHEREKVLGGTNRGWLSFVDGSREANEEFLSRHAPMVECMLNGDLERFLRLVREAVDAKQPAAGVNFNPTGQPMSPGA